MNPAPFCCPSCQRRPALGWQGWRAYCLSAGCSRFVLLVSWCGWRPAVEAL